MSTPLATAANQAIRTTRRSDLNFLGTYVAQRAAYGGLVPHLAAHPWDVQDLGSQMFLQVTVPDRQVRKVGRVGLEPTTGGL